MTRESVDNSVEFDATNGFGAVRGVHETNRLRTLAIDIREKGDGFELELRTDDADLAEKFGDDLKHAHPLHLTKASLWGAVQACRETWRNEVVERTGPDESYQFQFGWDFSGEPSLKREILPDLAEAGAKLFHAIFYPRAANSRPYEGLHRVGTLPKRAAACGSSRTPSTCRGA